MDFNADGYLDLISGDRYGYINYFRRLPNGTLTAEPDIIANGTTIDVGYNSAPCTVDWDEDGLLDLVIGNDTSETIWFYRNRGTPSNYQFTNYSLIQVNGTPIKYSRCVPHVCDLNLDGKKDLVIGEDFGYVYYLENVGTNAAPQFDAAVKLYSDGSPISWPSGQTDTRPWVDDWNGDGKPDLLLGNYAKNLYIYYNEDTAPLIADGLTLPEAGGAVNFVLDAMPDNGNRSYLTLGSVSGTTPGILLPGGHATLPLNWDMFTNIVIGWVNTSIFTDFMGTLNADGKAMATFNMPPVTGLSGIAMYYAYCLSDPFDYVSNPVQIDIVP